MWAFKKPCKIRLQVKTPTAEHFDEKGNIFKERRLERRNQKKEKNKTKPETWYINRGKKERLRENDKKKKKDQRSTESSLTVLTSYTHLENKIDNINV